MTAETFFAVPQLADAALSPSGKQLAVLAGVRGRIGLFVIDLGEATKAVSVASFNDADVRSFRWVNEQRLVFDMIDAQTGGGDQSFAAGLFSVKPDGKELKELVKANLSRVSEMSIARREPLAPNHVLLHVPRQGDGGGDTVIIGKVLRDNVGDFREIQPLRLNVVDGRSESLAAGMPKNATHWLFDATGEPRVATTVAQGHVRTMWREPGKDGWEQLAEFESNKVAWAPLFLDAQRTLYVRNVNAKGFAVLAKFDAANKKPLDDAIVSAPGFDFEGQIVTNRADGKLLGVHLTTDAATTVWFDDEMKRVQALADERWPGLVSRLSCRRCGEADQVVLVHSWSDRDPGQYNIYDAATKKWTVVGRALPQIDPKRMAQVAFERVKARDGGDLPLWLTLPVGMKPGTKPAQPKPAVVMVHGGPWVRGGQWRWNAMDQFLASRGYVVVSPEFRGSTGYGRQLFRAGWKQWGRTMQDDVADALQWAVREGYVDPKRVCIAGASYGGYAALMGLVRHPELYRCGVAWVAVTDVPELFSSDWRNDVSEEARKYSLPTLIGDPVQDADMLREASPVTHAARIKAPVLLAFGRQDTRVPIQHGERMRAALRAEGKEPEWIVYPDEGHGWLRLDHRVDFAQRLDKFLGQYLRD